MHPRASVLGLILCAMVALSVGCDSDAVSAASPARADLFGPTSMHVSNFTQIGDWTHSEKPDGIEAHLEFTDQFGDPTKATGRVLFELFDYRKESADPRGKRLAMWVDSISTLAEQRALWNTTLRTYRFQLDYPPIQPSQSYVLTAVFELSTGGRFFSRIVMPARPVEKKEKKPDSGLGL